MIDALVLLMSLIVSLIILRSLGGKGLNIKFQLAPISSSKGKKQHITIWIALSILFMGITFYFIRQNDADIVSLAFIPFILGALVALPFYLRSKK